MTTFQKTKTVQTDRIHLKVVGQNNLAGKIYTFALNGEIVPLNAIVEVSASDAGDLKARRLAVDATAGEVAAAGANVIVGPDRSDNWRDVA